MSLHLARRAFAVSRREFPIMIHGMPAGQHGAYRRGWQGRAYGDQSSPYRRRRADLYGAASFDLERVDIHLVQMNALTRQRIDMNARGVCS